MEVQICKWEGDDNPKSDEELANQMFKSTISAYKKQIIDLNEEIQLSQFLLIQQNRKIQKMLDTINDDVIENYKSIPEVLKIYNLSSANVTFEDCTIEYIIRNYCEDAGVRDLKNNIEKIICRIIGSGGADLSTVVTPDYAESVLNELVEETQGLTWWIVP